MVIASRGQNSTPAACSILLEIFKQLGCQCGKLFPILNKVMHPLPFLLWKYFSFNFFNNDNLQPSIRYDCYRFCFIPSATQLIQL